MCTSPLYVKNHSVYYKEYGQPKGYNVPCGRCLECRSLGQSEWQQRLSYEIKDLYARGGVAVFLTFTFNEEHLPYFVFNGVKQSCFDRKGVLTFLNRLKIRIYRKFGKGSYKYFFTSEYGKNTKRPHYHALFFLENGVDIVAFCETCRELWSDNGYMFPKYDKRKNSYVGNNGEPSQVTIKSLAGGAKYVSKYITKDLSFYDLPIVKEFSSSENFDKNCLPKHWQSNCLGYSLVKQVYNERYDESFIVNALYQGVVNPLTGKLAPLPRYVINKLMYDNVYTGRLNKDGKKLYDRQLSSFGRVYMKQKILTQLNKTFGDLYSFMSNLSSYDKYIKQFNLNYLYYYADKTSSFADCKQLACFSLVYRYFPKKELAYHVLVHGGDLSIFGDFDFASELYVLSKDTEYFRNNFHSDYVPALSDIDELDSTINELFTIYSRIVDAYTIICCQIRKETQLHYQRLNNAVDKMRLWFNAFPNNLC